MKMYFSSLILLVSFAHYAQAQSSTSSYVEPTVPTGTPIPGDYTGALRPQIHYSPPIDFMVSQYRPKTGLDLVPGFQWCVVRVVGFWQDKHLQLSQRKEQLQPSIFSDKVIERPQWHVPGCKWHLSPLLSM